MSTSGGLMRGATLRGEFLLRPDVIYLNHGSFGACPRPVFESYQNWQRELEAQPVEFMARRAKGLLADARRALGAYVGADADDIVFVPNATTALNIVARSAPLAEGDEVLGTDHEYGATERAWQFVCEKRGAAYVRAALPFPAASAADVVDAVWARVTPRTRVLVLSHITSPTALILPIETLIQRARRDGILTVIDGAHAPGQIPLDLTALGADFYAGNCHKWMCAPKGSGFLYARRDRQALLEPLVTSWGWRAETPGPSRYIDEHEHQGTRDLAAFLAVPAAIDFMAARGWGEVRTRCHALVRTARHAIHAITQLAPLCPDEPGWFAQMAALPLPPCDTEAVTRRLRDEFHIEVPIRSWDGRPLLRVSAQAYNTESDIASLTAAIRQILFGG
jgi:isopenicillin-N epimerase